MKEIQLIISTSPHIKGKDSVQKIMWTVALSLIPAIIAGTYFFGLRVLLIILISVITSVTTESSIQRLTRKKITTNDGSAVVTGILLAMVIPPGVPFWIPVVGAFCSIALAKAPFGGLGNNIFNPALIGRAILLASFPVYMTTWHLPISLRTLDSITGATTLGMIKRNTDYLPSLWNLFIGKEGGSIGETSALALLAGASILLLKGYISWHIPFSYVGTVAVVFGISELITGRNLVMVPIHLLSGGLILGAFFMATDMVTTPLTKKGGIIFGIGAGLLTCVIRAFGGYPEGVCYAILLMNALTPIIDRYVKPRRFGSHALNLSDDVK